MDNLGNLNLEIVVEEGYLKIRLNGYNDQGGFSISEASVSLKHLRLCINAPDRYWIDRHGICELIKQKEPCLECDGRGRIRRQRCRLCYGTGERIS